MRLAYLDCFAGISGDMFLGALVDAGVPRRVLEDATNAMGLGAALRFDTVDRSGISALKVHVMEGGRLAEVRASPRQQTTPEPYTQQIKTQHEHRLGHTALEQEEVGIHPDQDAEVHGRSLTVIRQMIQNSTLTAPVKALAIGIFELLGQSEAKIHNVPVDEIHFHEVGAVDAIVDIVAASAGIVHLDMGTWHSSPVNVGSGMVRCAHGLFPVPAPATADLLRGFPTYAAHVQKELVTPTGAAILRALAPSFGPQPAMTIAHIGYGAGTRNPADFPNVLRLSVGEAVKENGTRFASEASEQKVAVLETALDDTTPQVLAYVAEQALKLGALDVMLTPVLMKKGRPGTMVTVLANPEDTAKFEHLLFRETTTLGVRIRQERRVCLDRSHVTVETAYGTIRVKTGSHGGETLNATPEFEDCRHAAEAYGVPLKQAQAAAMAGYTSGQTKDLD